MMKDNYNHVINKLFVHFSTDELDQISTRSLFGGTGICYQGIMFGWIYDDQLYLRGHPEYLSLFTELNMAPLVFDIGVTAKLLQYYQVTDSLWQDKNRLMDMIRMVIEYANQDKISQRQLKESRIKDLPNMTLSLERALCKVGITDIASLRRLGAIASYHKLKQHNKGM